MVEVLCVSADRPLIMRCLTCTGCLLSHACRGSRGGIPLERRQHVSLAMLVSFGESAASRNMFFENIKVFPVSAFLSTFYCTRTELLCNSPHRVPPVSFCGEVPSFDFLIYFQNTFAPAATPPKKLECVKGVSSKNNVRSPPVLLPLLKVDRLKLARW